MDLKEYKRIYRQNNKEKINKYKEKYREENKENLREYYKKYRMENADKKKEQDKKYREANPDKVRKNSLAYINRNKEALEEKRIKRVYGINKTEYQEMLERQEGKCAICKKKEKLVIDHDHESGKVRGLLCTRCNTAIGYFLDDIESIKSAISYLDAEA